jgi:AbiV family abortive infection protein
MARKKTLPPLTAPQVVQLQNELLANADSLLTSALVVLDLGNVGLSRSLAILGLEESGKAIAIHRRRVGIAYAPEGESFVDDGLRRLWADHKAKLTLVHGFLASEEYWFGTGPPDLQANLTWLGEIEEWADRHNTLKQRGFYVDTDEQGDVLTPAGVSDEASLRQVIAHVHQIGWQLRLGEHIEAKQQAEMARATPPASEVEIEEIRKATLGLGADNEGYLNGLRQGQEGVRLNNDAYRLHLPENAFANLGKPGYEAETREVLWLAHQTDRLVDSDLAEKDENS